MEILYTDELYHHGIKGMHWGVRRYQNEDGSLKPAGVKHLASIRRKYTKLTRDPDKAYSRKAAALKAKYAELSGGKKLTRFVTEKERKKKAEEAKKNAEHVKKVETESTSDDYKKARKAIKNMSDQELRDAITRRELEKRYESFLPPKKEKFFKKAKEKIKDAALDATTNAIRERGKDAINKFISDRFGLNKLSAYDALKKQNDMSNWKLQIAQNNKKLSELTSGKKGESFDEMADRVSKEAKIARDKLSAEKNRRELDSLLNGRLTNSNNGSNKSDSKDTKNLSNDVVDAIKKMTSTPNPVNKSSNNSNSSNDSKKSNNSTNKQLEEFQNFTKNYYNASFNELYTKSIIKGTKKKKIDELLRRS